MLPGLLHVLGTLALYIAIFDLMQYLGMSPLTAWLLSTAYLFSPGRRL